MEENKKQKDTEQEEKVGDIPAEDLKGSDADVAYPNGDSATEQGEQTQKSDAQADKNE